MGKMLISWCVPLLAFLSPSLFPSVCVLFWNFCVNIQCRFLFKLYAFSFESKPFLACSACCTLRVAQSKCEQNARIIGDSMHCHYGHILSSSTCYLYLSFFVSRLKKKRHKSWPGAYKWEYYCMYVFMFVALCKQIRYYESALQKGCITKTKQYFSLFLFGKNQSNWPLFNFISLYFDRFVYSVVCVVFFSFVLIFDLVGIFLLLKMVSIPLGYMCICVFFRFFFSSALF